MNHILQMGKLKFKEVYAWPKVTQAGIGRAWTWTLQYGLESTPILLAKGMTVALGG